MARTDRANMANVTLEVRTMWLEADVDGMEKSTGDRFAAIEDRLEDLATKLRSATLAFWSFTASFVLLLITIIGTLVATRGGG